MDDRSVFFFLDRQRAARINGGARQHAAINERRKYLSMTCGAPVRVNTRDL
jgi:hypothetical protein